LLFKPDVFLHEANNLKYCSEILLNFESLRIKTEFNEKCGIEIFLTELLSTATFTFRTIRMLWGYSLENLLRLRP
jgi:hypothetical protein